MKTFKCELNVTFTKVIDIEIEADTIFIANEMLEKNEGLYNVDDICDTEPYIEAFVINEEDFETCELCKECYIFKLTE